MCLKIAFIEIKVIFIENNKTVPITHVILVIYYNKIKGLDKIVYRDELFSNSLTWSYRAHRCRLHQPKPPNRDEWPRYRSMLDCATVFGAWERHAPTPGLQTNSQMKIGLRPCGREIEWNWQLLRFKRFPNWAIPKPISSRYFSLPAKQQRTVPIWSYFRGRFQRWCSSTAAQPLPHFLLSGNCRGRTFERSSGCNASKKRFGIGRSYLNHLVV